jgi:oxygen-dependent protoporphyrinogen oxidase
LCRELGVAVEKASPAAKRRWIYIDGRLRALPRGPIQLLRTDLLTWRGKLALLREPFAPPRGEGDDESVHAFAARRFGAEAARAIVAPFVTGVFAADSHDVSLEAGFPRLAALDDGGGIVRGAARQAAKGLLARLTGKRSARTGSGMWAPVGGMGAIVDSLAAGLGLRVRTGRRVSALVPFDRGVLVDVEGRTEAGPPHSRDERWDAVVLAVPAQDAVPLVEEHVPELASRLRVFDRAPVAVVYLGMPARDVARARDGFGFLTAQGEDLRVLGVVFESTVWPGRAPDGQALLRCIFGGARDPEAVTLSDQELIDLAVRDVGHAFGTEAEPTHASVVRWPRGIAQYRVGHRDHVRAAVAAGRVHRIALAGADYRGAGLNDLCADADVVVAELRTWS